MSQESGNPNAAGKNDPPERNPAPPLDLLPTPASPQRCDTTPDVAPLPLPVPLEIPDTPSGRDAGSLEFRPEDSPIKVTFRTRDGTRSPYLTPILTNACVEFEFASGRPYASSYSGASSPAYVSTPNQVTPRFPTFAERPEPGPGPGPTLTPHPTPVPAPVPVSVPLPVPLPAPAPAPLPTSEAKPLPPPTLPAELPPEVVHRALQGRCRFIAFPPGLASEGVAAAPNGKPNVTPSRPAEGGAHEGALFIGQVRFETTPAELLWLIHRVSGACVSRLEGRGVGCYVIYCRSNSDLQLVRGIHKRVLFDIGGVWVARTAEEIDALCEYVALEAPVLSRKAHLPHDSMVVEEHKADTLNLAGLRHSSMRQSEQHQQIYMPYATTLLTQMQGISPMYPSFNPYTNSFPAPYRPFFPQVTLSNQSELPPPPPYNS